MLRGYRPFFDTDVEMVLTSLRAVKDVVWEILGDAVAQLSKATIRTCGEARDCFTLTYTNE